MKHDHPLTLAFTAASEKAIICLFPTAALDYVAEARELLASGDISVAEQIEILSFSWAKSVASAYCKKNNLQIARPVFRASAVTTKRGQDSINGKEGTNKLYVTPPAQIGRERMRMQQKQYEWEMSKSSELKISLDELRVRNEKEWLPHVRNVVEWAKKTHKEEWVE